jgi:desulfoferrodoxin (superoxide reductase-like protein)
VCEVEVVQGLQLILGEERLVRGLAAVPSLFLEAGRGRQQNVEQLLRRVGHVRHGVGKAAHQDRQAAHVVVVGVRDERVVDVAVGPVPHPVEPRERVGAVALRVGARVEGDAAAVEVEKVAACADAVGVSESEKFHVGRTGRRS